MTIAQHNAEQHLVTRCSWCGRVVELPEKRGAWDVRKYDPVFCRGTCLRRYQEHLKGSPF